MYSVGRNEPCPCGSGKKYKKCCANTTKTLDAIVYQEILAIQADIVRFAYTNYAEELKRVKEERLTHLKADSETIEAFDFYLTVWALCCSPIKEGTILEAYINKQKHVIQRPKLQAMLETWKGIAPSIYRTVSISGDIVTARNIFTEELFQIKLLTDEHMPEEEGLIIGTLAPFENKQYIFFTAYLDFPKQDAGELTEELKKQFAKQKEIDPEEYIKTNFQEILYFVLVAPHAESAIMEDDPQKLVADLLKNELPSDTEKETAVHLWDIYCQRRKPRIRNIYIYAAALHYLVAQLFRREAAVTQKELAERFSVSSNSLSSRYREMKEALSEEIAELEKKYEAVSNLT